MPYNTIEKQRAWGRRYRAANAERMRAYQREYRKKHSEHINAQHRSYARKNPLGVRLRHLRRVYGIDKAIYVSMIEFQAGLCAICCDPMNPTGGTHVDHCHRTGKVRSLLCSTCNSGIGHLQDNESVVYSGYEYLRLYS